MPLNLYDYLTELDNKRIENYVESYGTEDYIGNEEYLVDWKENNKKLFRLLGGNLIYSTYIEIDKDPNILESEMRHMVTESKFDELFNDLYYDTMPKRDKLNDFDYWTLDWTNLLTVRNLLDNKLCSPYVVIKEDPDTGELKTLKLSEGMKTLKAMRKIMDFLAPDNKELYEAYEQFRIDHSMVLNDKKLRGELCLSIHPLDFMTMSDNNSQWSSCMNWIEAGCYHTGTVEMMNSNLVICAYLKSDKPFNFSPEYIKSDADEWIWNNKKWRQLFYCTKDIIVGGKAYPYKNDNLTKTTLGMLRDLAWKNWNQKYQYGIEQYRDMIHINTLHKMENNRMWARGRFNPIKHNIIFDTKAMYNDMFNDKRTPYWCVRNKVKKNVMINLSGKVRCARCGDYNVVDPVDFEYVTDYYEENITEDDEYDYNSQYAGAKRILCPDCYDLNTCGICETETRALPTVEMEVPYYTSTLDVDKHCRKTHVCKACFLTKLAHCPTCGDIFNVSDMKYRGYGSLAFGAFKELDDVEDFCIRKYIDPLQTENGKTHSDVLMMYLECPCCNARRIRNTKVTRVSLNNIRSNYHDYRDVHIGKDLVSPKDKNIQKYFYENLKFCTMEEFETLRAEQKNKKI